MCPACLTTLILTAGGTGTASGLLALAFRMLAARRESGVDTPQEPSTR
ncbi:MAG: hypothetical protein U1E73_04165 [Planctomycetota bacterium]